MLRETVEVFVSARRSVALLFVSLGLLSASTRVSAQHVEPAPAPSDERIARHVPEAAATVAVSAAASTTSPVPRILVESLFAGLGTLIGTFTGGFTAALASGKPIANAIGVVAGGSLLGSLGAWTAGRLFGTDGSLPIAWGASLLGYGLGLGVVWAAASGTPGGDATAAAILIGGSLGTIGAVVGYELTIPSHTMASARVDSRRRARGGLLPWYDGRGGGLLWCSSF